jgi:hypothetical protein
MAARLAEVGREERRVTERRGEERRGERARPTRDADIKNDISMISYLSWQILIPAHLSARDESVSA